MKRTTTNTRASRTLVSYLILAGLFLSPAIFQGCDGLTGGMSDDAALTEGIDATTAERSFLRHAGLLDEAVRPVPGAAGKTDAPLANLFLAINPYEADGITPRLLDRYAFTTRILEEYGITRRLLNSYGITSRILQEFGITSRILEQFGITRRLLERYGITPRLLGQYGDQLTLTMLAEYGISENDLAAEGLTVADLDDINALLALLARHDVTFERFVAELDAFLQTIRIKVFIDDAHLGITVAFDASLLAELLDEFSNDTDILFAEPDLTIDVSDFGAVSDGWYSKQIIPWGITDIETPLPTSSGQYWAPYYKDTPVHVYILDSGAPRNSGWVDLEYVEKKDFTMLFEDPYRTVWEEDEVTFVSGFDPGNDGNPYDESGHGAHIAGTIGALNDNLGVVGVAPGVRLHSLKVLTREGRTDITTLMAAIDYVTRAKQMYPERPMVVNLSLGVDIGTTTYNVLDEAIARSIEAGVVYVAAAGNDGRSASTYSPAHVEGVIAVGSYNNRGLFSSFSNYGSFVDILAPGEDVISLSHLIEETRSFESILASGTSFAAPHVTGAVARYLGLNPSATAADVHQALTTSAVQDVKQTPNGTSQGKLNVKAMLGDSDQVVEQKGKWSRTASGEWIMN